MVAVVNVIDRVTKKVCYFRDDLYTVRSGKMGYFKNEEEPNFS